MRLDAYEDYKADFITSLIKQGFSQEQAIRAFNDYEEQEELEYQEMKNSQLVRN